MATDSSGLEAALADFLGRALNDAAPGETAYVQLHTRTDGELRASAGDTFPAPGDTIRVTARGTLPAAALSFDVTVDPAMPPGQYEVRSGGHAQRVVYDED